MSKQSEIAHSTPQEISTTSLRGDLILRQQDAKTVIKFLALTLRNVARLYSAPDWSDEKAVLLADWIFENYKYDSLDTIKKVLLNPPQSEKVWRLTPDTIKEWMAVELEKESRLRELTLSKSQETRRNEQENGFSEELKNTFGKDLQDLLQESLALANQKITKPILPLSEEEIELEGQEKPYRKGYHAPDQGYLDLKAKRIEWSRRYTDLETGKTKPGSPTLEEFLKQ